MKKHKYFITTMILFVFFLITNEVFCVDYYPLNKGMSWEYEYVTIGRVKGKSSGSFTKTVIEDSYKIGQVETVPNRYNNGNLIFLIKNGIQSVRPKSITISHRSLLPITKSVSMSLIKAVIQ